MARERDVESLLVLGEVEPDRGGGDHVHVEGLEREAPMGADSIDALAYLGELVLGEVHHGGARVVDGEAPEAGRTRGDADGDVEAEPRFRALGGARNHADGLLSPYIVHKPLGACRHLGQIVGPHDGESVVLGRVACVFSAGHDGHSVLRAAVTCWAETTCNLARAARSSDSRARASMARRLPRLISKMASMDAASKGSWRAPARVDRCAM